MSLVVFGVGSEIKVGVLSVLIIVSVLVLSFGVNLLGVCWVQCLLGFLLGTVAVDVGVPTRNFMIFPLLFLPSVSSPPGESSLVSGVCILEICLVICWSALSTERWGGLSNSTAI